MANKDPITMEPSSSTCLTSFEANINYNTVGGDVESGNKHRYGTFDDNKYENVRLKSFEKIETTDLYDITETEDETSDDESFLLKTRLNPASGYSRKVAKEQEVPSTLSSEEWFHLVCLLLAWACVVSCLTLAVSSSAVVVLSLGGSSNMAPFALGMFFLGQSLVSLLVTPWVFTRYGRKIGFHIGSLFGMIGTIVCAVAIKRHSPLWIILGNLPLGAGVGVGMYLRFAAVEIAPPTSHAFAITLVLSGGCLAAFIGPEAAHATQSIFGEELPYLGVFLVMGLFQVLNSFFVSLVRFAAPPPLQQGQNATTTNQPRRTIFSRILSFFRNVCRLFSSKQFVLSLLVGALSWAIMAMPMSLVRVAMKEVGYYSLRQSLLVIELHFLGMYLPGFVSGKFIARYGTIKAYGVAILCFVMGLCCNILATNDEIMTFSASILPWILGLALLGCGWNFGFSAATVELTTVYENDDENSSGKRSSTTASKAQVQAANDFLMFLFSGCGILSSGYIYKVGASAGDIAVSEKTAALDRACNGWRFLNYLCCGLTGLLLLTAVIFAVMNTNINNRKRDTGGGDNNKGDNADSESLSQ